MEKVAQMVVFQVYIGDEILPSCVGIISYTTQLYWVVISHDIRILINQPGLNGNPYISPIIGIYGL